MMARVERDVFHKTLHKAFQAREKKPSLPMCQLVKLSVSGDHAGCLMSIEAYDGDNYFKALVQATDCRRGEVIVDCQTLLRIIGEARGPVTLSTIEEDTKVSLKVFSDGCSYLLHSTPDDAGFFKEPKIGKLMASFSLGGKELREMINRVFYASGHSDTRYTLNSVPFIFTDDGLILVGTDGHRMALLKKKMETSTSLPERRNFIAPRRWLTSLMQIVRICDKEPEIAFTDSHALLKCGTTMLISRLVDGTYPKYDQVIPKKCESFVVFRKADMIRAIEKLKAIPIERKSYGTKILACHLGFSLSATLQGDYSAETDFKVESFDGPELEFGMNIHYLHEALLKCKSSIVSLGMTDQLSPMHLTETLDNESKVDLGNETYEAVVMPMKLDGVRRMS